MSRVLVCLVTLSLVPCPASAQNVSVVGGFVQGFVQGTLQGAPTGQPPRDVRPATGHSTIRGRVLAVENGQPMRRATVRITAPELRVARTALTDVDGRYEFRDLPAGRYSITVSKTAFVNWSYGQTQPGSPGKPLVLAENQTAEKIDIGLPRGAVITGRIIDEFGEPVPNANVMVLRQQFQRGQPRLVPANGFASTNDIGEYRMFGLAPGSYYVAAQLQQFVGVEVVNGVPNRPEGREARNGYAQTYYPGTADPTSAQRIAIGVAQTLSEINITLLSTRLASISGTAVDSQGRPMTSSGVSVTRRGGMSGFGVGGGQVRPDGTFTVLNIAPGEYILRTNVFRLPPIPGAQPVAAPEVAMAIVTVNGDDVTGVRLTPVVPVAIAGRVSFEDPAAAQSLKPSTLRVTTQQLDPDAATVNFNGPAGPPPSVAADLTFELKTNPGRIALNLLPLGTAGVPNPWRLKAVHVNGIDVTDTGFDVGSQGVSGVEIELTNQRQQVTGVVTDARGGAVKDYVVVLFAQDTARRTAAINRYFATARPGDDGTFKVQTLPPGEYFAIALDRIDQAELQDPDLLEGLSRQASAFAIGQGAARTLELKLFVLR